MSCAFSTTVQSHMSMDLWGCCSHGGKRGCYKLSRHYIQQGLWSPVLRDVAHHAKQWSVHASHPIPEVPWELGVRYSTFPMRSDLDLMRDNLAGSITNIQNQIYFLKLCCADGTAKHCNPINSSHPVTCDCCNEVLVSSLHQGKCDCQKISWNNGEPWGVNE